MVDVPNDIDSTNKSVEIFEDQKSQKQVVSLNKLKKPTKNVVSPKNENLIQQIVPKKLKNKEKCSENLDSQENTRTIVDSCPPALGSPENIKKQSHRTESKLDSEEKTLKENQ